MKKSLLHTYHQFIAKAFQIDFDAEIDKQSALTVYCLLMSIVKKAPGRNERKAMLTEQKRQMHIEGIRKCKAKNKMNIYADPQEKELLVKYQGHGEERKGVVEEKYSEESA